MYPVLCGLFRLQMMGFDRLLTLSANQWSTFISQWHGTQIIPAYLPEAQRSAYSLVVSILAKSHSNYVRPKLVEMDQIVRNQCWYSICNNTLTR